MPFVYQETREDIELSQSTAADDGSPSPSSSSPPRYSSAPRRPQRRPAEESYDLQAALEIEQAELDEELQSIHHNRNSIHSNASQAAARRDKGKQRAKPADVIEVVEIDSDDELDWEPAGGTDAAHEQSEPPAVSFPATDAAIEAVSCKYCPGWTRRGRYPLRDRVLEPPDGRQADLVKYLHDLCQANREIASIDAQIRDLQAARQLLLRDRDALLMAQRASAATAAMASGPTTKAKSNGSSLARLPVKTVDYNDSRRFDWRGELNETLAEVFGITKLRLCQEGVLNAVLDGRDVICIMPTGGGKSVCFQAPAVLSQGCTLVISPLISLMSDQVMHLKEKGIEAVMITGGTDQAEIRDITQRLMLPDEGDGRAIKLCYVTPEKVKNLPYSRRHAAEVPFDKQLTISDLQIAKSKTFVNTLSKMDSAGLLARIAIDESHCCSQLGHDFRPDYKKLSNLKQLFPKVPIIALTATCGKTVLNDVVRILRLPACTPGERAEPGKTVFFSAPLYRKHLHYSIRNKPASAPAVSKEMAEEILKDHANDTGIIYCLSQKDTMTVAQGLAEVSGGKIRTGTYHAGMSDDEKQRIHERWRDGKVKCVVATIAFGLGIDAPDVRYVYHHCISKSMEGYYQETGRAGRDGKDSDCVLWFRPADASRLSTLAVGEVEGHEKLYNMLKFALDYSTCRKLLFDAYFGNPASVVAPFAESDRSPCGHCDNCMRRAGKEGSVSTRDVTEDAWKACKIIRAMAEQQGRVTLPQAGDLVRGLGKGAFGTKSKNAKGSVDVQQLCGGKVSLSKDLLLLKLLIEGYLKEDFFATAYTTISYIMPGPGCGRLTRLSEAQLAGSDLKVELTTIDADSKKASSSGAGTKRQRQQQEQENNAAAAIKKAKAMMSNINRYSDPPLDSALSSLSPQRSSSSSSRGTDETEREAASASYGRNDRRATYNQQQSNTRQGVITSLSGSSSDDDYFSTVGVARSQFKHSSSSNSEGDLPDLPEAGPSASRGKHGSRLDSFIRARKRVGQ